MGFFYKFYFQIIKYLYFCAFNCFYLSFKAIGDFYFENIDKVSTVQRSGVQFVMHTGGRMVLSAQKSGKDSITYQTQPETGGSQWMRHLTGN